MKNLLLFFICVIITNVIMAQSVPKNWTITTEALTVTEETVNTSVGNKAAILEWSSTVNQVLESDAFTVTPGENFSTSLDVYDNSSSGSITIVIAWSNGDENTNEISVDQDGWQTLNFSSVVPVGASSAKFKIVGSPQGTMTNSASIIVDNAIYIENSSSNLIANGSFESWLPTLSITSPIDNTVVNDDNVTVTLGVSDFNLGIDGRIQYTLNGGTAQYTTSNTINITDLTAGNNALAFQLVDMSNNPLNPTVTQNLNIIYQILPTLTITSPMEGQTVNTDNVDVAVAVTDFTLGTDGKVAYSLNGTLLGYATASPISITNLTHGSNSINLYLVDMNDRPFNPTISQTVTVLYEELPTLTITSPANGQIVYEDNISVAYIVDNFVLGTNGKVAYNLNGTLLGYSTTNSVDINNLVEGANTIELQLVDMSDAAITPAVTQSVSVTYQQAPTLTITNPIQDQTVRTDTVNVEFTATNFTLGTNGSIEYSLNGTVLGYTTTSPIMITGLTVGNNTIMLQLVDNFDNELNPAVSQSVDVIYRPLATLAISSPVNGAIVTSDNTNVAFTTPNFTLGVDGKVGYTLNGGTETYVTSSSINLTDLTLGSNTLVMQLVDMSDNPLTPAVSQTVTFTYQAIPTLAITSPIQDQTVRTDTVNVEFTATNFTLGTSGSVQYSLNGTVLGYTSTSPIMITGLAVGSNTIMLQLVDNFDNTLTPAVSESVDVIYRPLATLVVTSPVNGAIVTSDNTNVAFTTPNFTLGVDGKVGYTLNGGTETYVTSSPINLTGLTLGSNTLVMQLVDMSDNPLTPAVSQTVTFTYQATPTLAISSPAQDQTVNVNNVNVAFTVTDFTLGTNGSVQYSLNGNVKGYTTTSPITITGLTLGSNTIELQIVDNFNNPLTPAVTESVDVLYHLMPTLTVNSPVNGETVTEDNVDIQFTTNNFVLGTEGSVEYSLNGTISGYATTSPVNLSGLVEGNNTIMLQLVDLNDAALDPAVSQTITISYVLNPSLTITSPTEGQVVNTDNLFVNFTTDNFTIGTDGNIQYSLNGTVVGTSTDANPINITGLTAGSNTIELQLVDMSNNPLTPAVTSSVNIVYQTSSYITINSPAAGTIVNDDNIEVDFSVTNYTLGVNSQIEYSLNGTSLGYVSTSPINVTGLTEGANTITLQLVDMANDPIVPADIQNVTVIYRIIPTLAITSPVEGQSVAADNVDVAFTVTDFTLGTEGSVRYSLNGTLMGYSTTSPFNITGLTPGNNTIQLQLVDNLDNLLNPAVTETVNIIYQLAPELTILNPVNGETVTTDEVEVEFTVENFVIPTNGSVQYSLNSAVIGYATQSPFTISGLVEGSNVIDLQLVDEFDAPLTPAVTQSITVTYRLLPTLAITNPSNEIVEVNNVDVEFTTENFTLATDGNIQYSLNGTVLGYTAASPVNVTGLTAGNNTVMLQLVDAYNNPLSPAVSQSVNVIYQLAPVLAITSPADGETVTEDNVDVAFTVSNFMLGTNGQVEYSLNGTSMGYTTTSPINITGLTAGENTIELQLVDESDVALDPAVTQSITVNYRLLPTLTITNPSNNAIVDVNNVDVEFTTENFTLATDGNIQYSLNGTVAGYTSASPVNVTGLTAGNNTVMLQLVDTYNNPLSPAVSQSVNVIYQLAPVLAITNPLNGETVTEDNVDVAFTVSNFMLGTNGQVEYSLNGTSMGYTTTSPVNITGLTAGENTVELQLVDMSDNPLNPAVTETVTFTYSLSPELIVSYPIEGQTVNNDSVNVAFTVNNFVLGTDGSIEYLLNGTSIGYTTTSPVNISGLTAGTNSIELRLVDNFTNVLNPAISHTVNIMYEMPKMLTITSPLEGQSVNVDNIAVAFSVENFVLGTEGSVAYGLNGTTIGFATSSPVNISGLTPGSNNISLELVDMNDAPINPAVITDVTVIYQVPPTLLITNPTDGEVVTENNIEVEFTVTDFNLGTQGKVQYILNSGTPQYTISSPINISDLVLGSNTIELQLVDMSNNPLTPAVTQSISVTYATPDVPVLTITSPQTGDIVNTPEVDVAYTVTNFELGTDGQVGYILNGGTPAYTTSNPINVTGLTEGNNTIELRLVDMAQADLDPVVSQIIIVEYKIPPTLTITRPTEGQTIYTDTVNVISTVTNFVLGTDGKIKYSLNNGTVQYATTDIINVSGLTVGNNEIELQLVDMSDNPLDPAVTQTVNVMYQLPPVITITSPTDEQTVHTEDIDVLYTVNNFTVGTDGKVAYSLNSGTINYTTSNTINIEGLTEGSNIIGLQLVDMDNNPINPIAGDTVTVIYQILPTLVITDPLNGATVTTEDVNVTFAVEHFTLDTDGKVEYFLNGTSKGYITASPVTVTGLELGENTIELMLVDMFDNALNPSVSQSITVNYQLPPSLTITSPADGSVVNVNNVNVAFTVADFVLGTDGKVEYTLNGGTAQYVTTASPINITNLVEGPNTIQLQLVDMDNNPLDPAVTHSITVNYQLAPVLTISSPLEGQTVHATNVGVVFTVENFELGTDGSVAYRANNGSYSYSTTSPINITGLVLGENTIELQLVDMSDNPLNPAVVETVNVFYMLPPSLTISYPINGQTVNTDTLNVVFSVNNFTTGTDGQIEYILNGGTAQYTTASPIHLSGLTEGTNTIEVQLVDMSNNPLNPAVSRTLTVNYHIAPVLVITSPTNGETINTDNVSVEFTTANFVIGTNGKVAYSLNGGTVNYALSSPINITGLVSGTNTIQLQLVDLSNNPLTPPVVKSVMIIHQLQPALTITSPANGETVHINNVDVEFETTNFILGIQGKVAYSANGGAVQYAIASPINIQDLNTGINNITLQLVDMSDQVLNPDVTQTISVIYSVNPILTITEPVNNVTVNEDNIDIEFTVSGFEPGSDGSVRYSLNGTIQGYATSSPINITDLTIGANTIELELVNLSNIPITPAVSESITVNYQLAPVITITSPADGATVHTEDISVVFSVSDFDLGTDGKVAYGLNGTTLGFTTSSPVTIQGLDEGNNTISLELVDMNDAAFDPIITSSIDVVYQITPVLTITSPNDGEVVRENNVDVEYTTLNFTAGTDGRVAYKLNNGTVQYTTTSPITISNLLVGSNAIELQLVNMSNSPIAPAVIETVNVIYQLPSVITITSPIDEQTVTDDNVDVVFSISDFNLGTEGKVKYSLNGTALGYTTVSPVEISNLTVGLNTITLELVDMSDNLIEPAVSANVRVMYEIIPTLTITSPQDGEVVRTDNVDVAFTVNNFNLSTDGKVQYTLNNGAPQLTVNNSVNVTGLTVGNNTIMLQLVDMSDNPLNPAVSQSITVIYQLAPVITITSPVEGETVYADNVDVAFTINDFVLGTDGKVMYSLNDGTGQYTINNSINISNLILGENTIELQLVDMNDVAFNPAITATVTVNRVDLPALTIVSPNEGDVVNVNNVDVAYTVSNFVLNTDGKVEYKLNNGTAQYSLVSPINITGLTEGSNNIQLQLVDMSNNPLSPAVVKTVSVTYEIEPVQNPTLTITSPNNGTVVTNNSVQVSFTTTEFNLGTDGKVQYSLNGTVVNYATSSPIAISNLTEGSNNIQLQLVNMSNNPLTPAVVRSVSVTYEPTPVQNPTLTITSPNNNATVTTNSVQVSFTTTEFNLGTNGKVQYSLNGTVVNYATSSPITISNLTEGSNLISLQLVDMSNQPLTPAVVKNVTVNYQVDPVLNPTLTITSPEEGSTVSTDEVVVRFEVSDFVVGTNGYVEYQLNNGVVAYARNNNPITITGLTRGENTIYFSLVDMDEDPLTPEVSVELTVNYETVDILVDFAEGISIYPNPATEYINIELPMGADNIIIMNSVGQIVYEMHSVSTFETINVSAFEPGSYMVRVSKANDYKIFKFIVK